MPAMKYVQAIREALAEELERDPSVFVMGEDMGAYGGVFGETGGLQQRFGPERVFDTPISESLIVGAGVGAAITGSRPVVGLQFADFVTVAMDEIYNKAAKWAWMHGGVFTMPLVIFAPEGAIGGAGPEHSQCPEGMFWSATGLAVITPATPADAKGLLKSAIRSDEPVLFLAHKALFGTSGEVPEGEHLVPLGSANVVRRGSDVTVVAWSAMVGKAIEAASRLAPQGIDCEVVDARGVRPFDWDTVLASVDRTGRVVIAHEAAVPGGPGSEVAAVIADRSHARLKAPVKRVGAMDVPIPQNVALERLALPQAADIESAIRTVMGAEH